MTCGVCAGDDAKHQWTHVPPYPAFNIFSLLPVNEKSVDQLTSPLFQSHKILHMHIIVVSVSAALEQFVLCHANNYVIGLL